MDVRPDREAAAVVLQHSDRTMTNNLIIFVKYPEPGNVKTRISNVIGNEKAAELYYSLARHIVNSFIDSDDFKVSVCFSPENKYNLFESWFNNSEINYFPQKGKSLGERISRAFEHSFSDGFKNTVIIGSDCIELNCETVTEAFYYLNNGSDCVIGPTFDGGYYLIGLKSQNVPYIFEDIPWSSDSVFDETIKKINYINLKSIILEKLNDVDEINDLNDNVIDLVRNYYPNFKVKL